MTTAPTQYAQGDASLVVADPEATLGAAITTAGHYFCRLDFNAAVVGDRWVLHAYVQTQTTGQGGTEHLWGEWVYDAVAVLPIEKVIDTPVIPNVNSLTFKLAQPNGTSRTILWEQIAL